MSGRCLAWSAAGLLLGVAALAQAQELGPLLDAAASSSSGGLEQLLHVFAVGGLPLSCVWLGWRIGRAIERIERHGGLVLTVRLHPDDLAALRPPQPPASPPTT